MIIDRLSLKFSGEYIKKELCLAGLNLPTRHNYNIYTGQQTLCLSRSEDNWHSSEMNWGFQNKGQTGHALLNARSEGILSQPTFRFAVRENRMVIPVDSYYTSQIVDRKTIIYRVAPVNDAAMYIAGISQQIEDGQENFALLTLRSNRDTNKISSRMPLIFFDKESVNNWCNPMNVSQLADWLQGTHPGRLRHYRVTDRILQNINAPVLHESVEEHLTLFD